MWTPVSATRMAPAAVERIPSRSRLPIQRPPESAAALVHRNSSSPTLGWTWRGTVMPLGDGAGISDFTGGRGPGFDGGGRFERRYQMKDAGSGRGVAFFFLNERPPPDFSTFPLRTPFRI